jgi:hypothetical protein
LNIPFLFSIGSIFGIWKKPENAQKPIDCVLQSGEHIRCAGYAVYGSACMLVLATREGVNGFTLDPVCKENFFSFNYFSFYLILVYRRIYFNITKYANATIWCKRITKNL